MPIRLLFWLGCPDSLVLVARQVLQRDPTVRFLCILGENETSESIRRVWESSIQPQFPSAHLSIFHADSDRKFEMVAEFARELASEIDFLFVSDVARGLPEKQLVQHLSVLTTSVPGATVRRV